MERTASLNNNETHLQSDLTQIVRRIKQRQQDHRRFYQYNNKINSRWNELVDQIYIHDELSKLRAYVQDKLTMQQSQQELDAQLSSRYEHMYTCGDPLILLMKRVTNKVIQIAQTEVESLKQPIQYYSLTFNRFKTTCMRASSDAISCRPSNMVKIFSRYLHHKVNVQAERLKEIIKCLQLSDCNRLQTLKDAYYQRLTLKELTNAAKRQVASKQLRSDSTSIASIKIIRKQVKPMQSEKQIRIKLAKTDEKQKQKIRKLQIKRLKKYVQSICEVMDVNKQQMLEDVFIDCKQSQSRRIFTQLTGRNKHNFTQIQIYIDKSKDAIIDTSLLEVKPVKPLEQQLMFSNVSSQRIIAESSQVIKVSPSKNQRQANSRYTRRQSLNTKPRNIYKKQRKTVNNMEEIPNKEICQSQKVSSQFVQINMKEQAVKQRFPQIYARATSVDNVKMQKKEVHLKFLKDQKLHKQQLQLARAAIQSSNQTFTSKKHFAENAQISSKEDKFKGRQKIESKIKLQLKTGSNFFEQIGKRISKFCEMKKNLKV